MRKRENKEEQECLLANMLLNGRVDRRVPALCDSLLSHLDHQASHQEPPWKTKDVDWRSLSVALCRGWQSRAC